MLRMTITALLLMMSFACAPETSEPATEEAGQAPAAEEEEGTVVAVAELSPTEGNDVQGKVTFEQTPDGVHVTATVTGLQPGKHGFHIHENGDCSAPDASSAGGHFNPTNVEHGNPNEAVHHIGDLGNLEAGDQGTATYDETWNFLSLEVGSMNSILGKAVIVHSGVDDFVTQPTGNAGSRVACGVVQEQ